jgi:hypothetical protein
MGDPKAQARWVCASLARAIRKCSNDIADCKGIKPEELLALAKLTDSYEKVRKVADGHIGPVKDPMEYGDPNFVGELEKQSEERAKSYDRFGREKPRSKIKRRKKQILKK